jgi:hypothetical protein
MTTEKKILTRMVEQYQARNNSLPTCIKVHPLALIVLVKRQSMAPVWNGIKVVCEEVMPIELNGSPDTLGICVINNELTGFDLCSASTTKS